MLNILQFSGADPTGVTDQSPVFDRALAYINAHGGSLYVPAGYYRMASPCAAIALTNKSSGLRMFGDGASTQLLVDDIGDNRLFDFANNTADRIVFHDLAFRSYSQSPIGPLDPAQIDCGSLITVTGSPIGGLCLERCSFIALAAAETDAHRGLVEARGGTRVAISDCTFGGCCAGPGSIVYVTDPSNVVVERTTFIDYFATIDGTAWGKSTGRLAWILVEAPTLPGGGRVFVKDCFFDEGAAWHVRIGDLVTDERFASVWIEGCYSNVGNAASGHLIQFTDQANIVRSTFAWAVSLRPAITLFGVTQGTVDQCTMLMGATDIVADASTERVLVKDTSGYTLASSATYTTIEREGISSTNDAFPAPFPLTVRVYGSYEGERWRGVPSSGNSGGRDFTGIAPVGAGVDGYAPPEWDGVTSTPLINAIGPATNVIGANSAAARYMAYAVFNVDVASGAVPPYEIPPFLTTADFNSTFYFGFTSAGVTIGHFSGGYNRVDQPCGTGGWHFALGWYDGTNLNLEVDGVAAVPVPAPSPNAGAGGTLNMGVSPQGANLVLDGRIMEAGAMAVDLSYWREVMRAAAKKRYPSMALP